MAFAYSFTSSQVVRLLVLLTLTGSSIIWVNCLNFSYSHFSNENKSDFIFSNNSEINEGARALLVSPAILDPHRISNMSGRVLYKQPFRLWDNRRNMKTSFKSSFVINIMPVTSTTGDGLAFILTEKASLPENSGGQWLGIINSSTTGLSNIVAVEFDTRKSFKEDIDDNHIDVRSVVSMNSHSLTPDGLYLSSGIDITATVQYDAQSTFISILVSSGEESMDKPVLSQHLDLSDFLPQDVYVGFSASTEVNASQFNAILSWNFTSFETYDKESVTRQWIWITVSGVLGYLLFIVILYKWYCWKKQHEIELLVDEDPEIEQKIYSSSTAPQKFRFKDLKFATDNFGLKNKLGKGGFGTVYKGTLGGKAVAVKRISKNSRHGKKDFIAEVNSIGNIHHKNLVKLIGWCYESNELLLVYEFMPNGSLDKLIFSNESTVVEDRPLTWKRRHNIIYGVAQALDYLHNGCEKRVLHRDIKASNVLLDIYFNARLGDFGLARVIQLKENTHHSTKEIAGTPGYMAPESFHTGRATVETDVYAFGVLILEIVCGKRPGQQCEVNKYNNSIVDWVWENYRMDKLSFVVDSRINEDADKEEIKKVLMLALACCHPNPYERPSIKIALHVLTGEAEPPEVTVEKPAFMWPVLASFREEEGFPVSGGQLTATTELSGR
ncbi:hypothetical protein PTKIN_Ptkin07bG0057600 [Pterospermum kingtungense]